METVGTVGTVVTVDTVVPVVTVVTVVPVATVDTVVPIITVITVIPVYFAMQSALIVCNGEPPSAGLLKAELRSAEFSVAADGGVKAFLRDNLTPNVVIGDLDSQPAELPPHWIVMHVPDQETNDLEKALQLVLERNFTRVVVLGAVGLRTDHTLKNLSVMVQFHQKFEQLEFRDERFDLFVIPKNYRRSEMAGKTISLFPISGKVEGITLTGFKYPLSNETLENGVRDGSSNEAAENDIAISYKNGVLIGFFER